MDRVCFREIGSAADRAARVRLNEDPEGGVHMGDATEGLAIGRRRFLRLASGTVAAVMFPIGLNIEGRAGGDDWWIAEVTGVGGVAGGKVTIDSWSSHEVIDIMLDGFPVGWELAHGDLVALNAKTRTVTPYLVSAIQGMDLVYFVRNADLSIRREFARRQLLGEPIS